MKQASVLDGLSFDPFSFKQDGLASAEVDIGRGEIGDALMVSQVIVVSDEVADFGFKVTGEIIFLKQDAILQRLVPALDLALGLGMERMAFAAVQAAKKNRRARIIEGISPRASARTTKPRIGPR